MRQYELAIGGSALFLKIEFMVTKAIFAQQLCEHYYRLGEDFNKTLSKKEGKTILIDGLKWHGRMGEYDSESLGTDNIDCYNAIYAESYEWVCKNYPNII